MLKDPRAEQQIIIERDTGIGYRKEEIRSYEVSLWTLQDSFITVLKWSDSEQLGRIENPKMKLNVDGTESFTFSIPMYIWSNGRLIDNPNWYTVKDNQIIQNMRKIKVTFNKNDPELEQIFEFLVVTVNEEHENDILTCEITCEGLAFNELGKIGYMYSLSPEVFYNEMDKWFEDGQIAEKPVQNIDFWCAQLELEKVPDDESMCEARTWYYKVDMDWSGYQAYKNRQSNVIYEEAYASEWNADLQPTKIVEYREKERPVEAEKSNLYNLTQNIAEAFGVFCKYEYLHNQNQQIIGRRIIFYNNYFAEQSGMFTLNYPHSTSKVSRKTDGTNLTTKLFVSDVETDETYDGVYSIMNAEANIAHENYIMNFDYMLEAGAISQDQYDEITPYLKQIKQLNEDIERLQSNFNAYEQEIPKLEATIKVCDKNIETANQEKNQNDELFNNITAVDGSNNGYIDVTFKNPKRMIVLPDNQGNYIKLTDWGVVASSIKIFHFHQPNPAQELDQEAEASYFPAEFKKNSETKTNQITNFFVETNEQGYATIIRNVPYYSDSVGVYLTYQYSPKLQYDAVNKQLNIAICENEKKKLNAETRLGKKKNGSTPATGLYLEQETIEADLTEKYNKKKILIKNFERMMGPALREGYWSPDDYADFGDMREEELTIPSSAVNPNDTTNQYNTNVNKNLVIGWDTRLFEDEDELTYQVGLNQDPESYPCVRLVNTDASPAINIIDSINTINAAHANDSNYIPHTLEDYYFVFITTTRTLTDEEKRDLKNLQIYKVGSQAIVRYVRDGNGKVYPILVLTGAKTLSDSQLTRLYKNQAECQPALAIINGFTDDTTNLPQVDTIQYIPLIGQNYWVNTLNSNAIRKNLPNNTIPVELRIKCSSLDLKTDPSNLFIKYIKDTSTFMNLEPYEHYYVNTRTNQYTTNTTPANTYHLTEYFITIKPTALIQYNTTEKLSIQYTISNASLAIYQDATQVLKENSRPKVSYEITPTILDRNLTKHLYNTLAQIIMINDVDLKLFNTFGYISELELNLDQPQDDSIVVQNYTTKFEDLFSSIVAQTEGLQRSKGAITQAASGNIPLSTDSFTSTLSSNTSVLQAYLDSAFDSSEVVAKRLQSLFTEAATILGDAKKSLNYSRELSIENASILSGLVDEANELLRNQVYSGKDRPKSFKVGDIWIRSESERYVAISNSEEVQAESQNNSFAGFTRTYDGSLAAITGAGMDIDAAAGTINIKAAHSIGLNSGSVINISANDNVYIHGNKNVDITGTTINLTTSGTIDTTKITPDVDSYGINLLATGYSTSYKDTYVARILLNPKRLLMAGAEIKILTGETATDKTSAIEMNNTGLKLFSNTEIKLFAGKSNDSSGASIEMSPSKLFLSYYSSSDNTANNILLDKNGILLGSGNASNNVTMADLMGVQIKKDMIGFAIGSNSTRTAFLMNSYGLTLGYGDIDINLNDLSESKGSYVRLSGESIELGSLANLYINTNNLKLQTDAAGTSDLGTRFAVGENLNNVDTAKTLSEIGTNFKGLVYNKNGLFVSGVINATSGKFYGEVTATKFILEDNGEDTMIPAAKIKDLDKTIASNSWHIDGLSNNERNLTTNGSTTKIKTVELTAKNDGTDPHALVLGSSKGVFIPRTASSTLDESNCYVRITSESLFFACSTTSFIKLYSSGLQIRGAVFQLWGTSDRNDPIIEMSDQHLLLNYNDSNNITLKDTGIWLQGSQIYINGEAGWSRDDIIVMNPSAPEDEAWRRSQEGIETHQNARSDKKDWVLIKPINTTNVSYTSNWIYDKTDGDPLTKTSTATLGTADSYTYTVRCCFRNSASTSWTGAEDGVQIRLGNTSVPRDMPIVIDFGDIPEITGNNITGNFGASITSQVNLCAAGNDTIFATLGRTKGRNTSKVATELTLTVTTGNDSSTYRVPCSIYYYPE